MVMTGGDIAHVATTMWRDGKLYVLESQYAWYLPNDKKSIQAREYDTWMTEAFNAGLHVAWVPLSDEYRQKFDSDKAWEFFTSNQGLRYGF